MGRLPHAARAHRFAEWGARPKPGGADRAHDRTMQHADPADVAELIAFGRDREAARRGAAPLMDPLTQLDLLAPQLESVVAGITPADLGRPTPCAEFDVRGVLEHMIGGATMFAAAYRGTTAVTPNTSDPLAAFGPAL